jgi:hypothetical protein
MIESDPWYGVALGRRPVGSAVMVSAEGAVALLGFAFSHVAWGNTLKPMEPLVVVTLSVCD